MYDKKKKVFQTAATHVPVGLLDAIIIFGIVAMAVLIFGNV